MELIGLSEALAHLVEYGQTAGLLFGGGQGGLNAVEQVAVFDRGIHDREQLSHKSAVLIIELAGLIAPDIDRPDHFALRDHRSGDHRADIRQIRVVEPGGHQNALLLYQAVLRSIIKGNLIA